jgi:hypothetical protein
MIAKLKIKIAMAHSFGLLQALTGSKTGGQWDVLLASGLMTFPDTEEATSSNLVPPTR